MAISIALGATTLQASPAPQLPAIRAAAPGVRITAPDAVGEAERVALDADLSPLLLRVPEGTSLRVADWPVAPGLRSDVMLTRHEVYSRDAKIFKVDGGRTVEVPRSRLAFFWGSEESDGHAGVFVAVDPDSGEVHGLTQSASGIHELRRSPTVSGGNGDYLVAAADSLVGKTASSSELPTWSCGEEDLPAIPRFTTQHSAAAAAAIAATASSLSTATIAIDTDNELMAQKFADNTTKATNYIASLVAAMNVMYERDLQVRLLQGTTFLRVSTTTDPYAQPANSGATTNNLSEFTSYWSQNEGSVNRALAVMLSGKQSVNNVSSGIAWIGGLCNTQLGYSYTQVFKIDYLAGDAQVVGHEIGHNFGTPHTHCYSPPVDGCFNAESGCYSGPATCPAPSTIGGVSNVQGTVMSYCNQLGGCSASLVFHPRTVDMVRPNISDAMNQCIFPMNTAVAASVSAISPKTGPIAGGTRVTITGTSFQSGATVTVGGTAATAITVVDASTITATTPAHATAAVDVVVTNPGSGAATLVKSFFYAPPPATAGLFTLAPCRALDTRNADGPLGGPALAAQGRRTFVATGSCAVPSTARSLSANVTVINPAADGFLSLYPGNAFPLGTRSVGFKAGSYRSNNVVLELATDGTGSFGVENSSNGTVQLIVDVNGYFE